MRAVMESFFSGFDFMSVPLPEIKLADWQEFDKLFQTGRAGWELLPLLSMDDDDISDLVEDVGREHLSGTEGNSEEAYLECVFRKSRGLLYGCTFNDDKGWKLTEEEQAERTEFFESLETLENLKKFLLKMKRVLLWACVNDLFVLPDSEEYRRSVQGSITDQDWDTLEGLVMPLAIALLGRVAVVFHGVAFAVTLLLSFVHQYLTALFGKGGTRTYSAGALEFRATYISIVLFQGAYVWIKFRDVAPPSQQRPSPGLHRKSRVTADGVVEFYGNFEPRFKPPGGGGKTIYVGVFEEEEDAKTMYKIVAFYYGKHNGELDVLGGDPYTIAPMTEDEQQISGEEKVDWVKRRAKDVYDLYKLFLDLFCPVGGAPPLLDSSAPVHGQVVGDAIGLGTLDGGLVSRHPNNGIGPDGQEMPQVVEGTAIGMQEENARDPLLESSSCFPSQASPSDPARAFAGPSEERPDFQHPATSVQDHGAINSTMDVILDDFSLRREVSEIKRQQELEILRCRNQISELQLLNQQQGSRISELLGVIESIRNSERICKRCCYGTNSARFG